MVHEFRKIHHSRGAARHERSVLRLVEGPGVVPLIGGTGADVVTACGAGSLADLLAETGALPEAVARGTGVRIAQAVARLHERGIVHGDVKPANITFAPDGDLWLIDFDAAGADHGVRRRGTTERLRQTAVLRAADDVVAVAVMAVECATGTVIDPSAPWDQAALGCIGCSRDLAADIALVLRTPLSAAQLAAVLQRRDDRLPRPPGKRGVIDPTPTVDISSIAIAGLNPLGGPAASGPPIEPSGWRRWARPGRD